MAYNYNKNTGEFEKDPGSTSFSETHPSHNWKKVLRIAIKIALPILSFVIVLLTGIPIDLHD